MQEDIIEIDDKLYTLNGKIGEGGAGVVYLVRDQNKKSYALKIVRLSKHNPMLKQMIDAQIKIQKSFAGNQYVIQYIGVKQQPKQVSIVLQLGEYSLRNCIQIRHMLQKQLLSMICDVSNGLYAIHNRKVIHRDIKPENIIFKGGKFKITDFGVSVQLEQDDSIIGTVPYWAPQIILQKKSTFTNKIDVWSLGVTAFQSFFKIHPFYPVKGLGQKQGMEQIKMNIQQLTPNFSIKKFLQLLDKKNLLKQKKYIQKKLEITKNKQIINSLCQLFEPDPDKRHSIDVVLAIFSSLQSSFVEVKVRTTKFNEKHSFQAIPEDIKMFCRAKDLFYEMNVHTKSELYDKTLFGLEIAIWYLQGANYGGIHYVLLDKINLIKDYHKPKQKLWKQVFQNLSEYYYQIKFTSQSDDVLQYFDKLNELRIYILICSVWMRIIRQSKRFCEKISKIVGFQIYNQLEIFTLLPLFSEKKFNQIQQIILTQYCYD